MSYLTNKTCTACNKLSTALPAAQRVELKAQVHADWKLDSSGNSLSRRFEFKGFAKAVYTANLAAFISDKEGHHADVSFGWGYCEVTFTTHDVGGLTENDFICAAKLDTLAS